MPVGPRGSDKGRDREQAYYERGAWVAKAKKSPEELVACKYF